MDSEAQIIPDNRAEVRKINVLLERYREEVGGFDLVPVGNCGYILQRQSHKPMAGNDWAMFDYDDTLAAYTEAKTQRQELYMKYLRGLDIDISSELAAQVMQVSDVFSRWEEQKGEGKLYHVGAHMTALQWATNELKDKDSTHGESLVRIQTLLNRIRPTHTNKSSAQNDDPFYIRESDQKFILKNPNAMWSKALEDIFQKTTMNPPLYDETVAAAVDIGTPPDSIHRINVSIFSRGEIYFQLAKILELLKQNPDLPISQIWLTKKSKGDFIVEAVESNATAQLEQEYIPQDMLDETDDGPSYGSGYVLGQFPHTVVVFDDNPKELISIVLANEYLKKNSGASFVSVRSIRKGTREQLREWQMQTKYGTVDFTAKSYVPRDISNIFLMNRYYAIKTRLGQNHPNTIKLSQELSRRGINILSYNR